MRRKIAIGLLIIGAIAGFGAGFARLASGPHYFGLHDGHGRWHERRAAFERHVAELCAGAAVEATRAERQAE